MYDYDILDDTTVRFPPKKVGESIGGMIIRYDENYDYYLYECNDCGDEKSCQYILKVEHDNRTLFPSSCPIGIKAKWVMVNYFNNDNIVFINKRWLEWMGGINETFTNLSGSLLPNYKWIDICWCVCWSL